MTYCSPVTTRDLVINALRDWADWTRQYKIDLGYPRRSAGLSSGYVSSTFDELCEPVDDARLQVINKCVYDLDTPAKQAAIFHRYLHSVYRMRDYPKTLEQAHCDLTEKLVRAGVLTTAYDMV